VGAGKASVTAQAQQVSWGIGVLGVAHLTAHLCFLIKINFL
jgi:hypothetical protein